MTSWNSFSFSSKTFIFYALLISSRHLNDCRQNIYSSVIYFWQACCDVERSFEVFMIKQNVDLEDIWKSPWKLFSIKITNNFFQKK